MKNLIHNREYISAILSGIALTIVICALVNHFSYVDLGLPSGTKWKTFNQYGYYTHSRAMKKFKNKMPTTEQYEELIQYCKISYNPDRDRLEVTGPNGKRITFSAKGQKQGGSRRGHKNEGLYWTSTRYKLFHFSYYDTILEESAVGGGERRHWGNSVRLVK